MNRLLDAHPALAGDFENDRGFVEAAVAVSVASHSLFRVLQRDVGALESLRRDSVHAPITLDGADDLPRAEDPLAALRRWKHCHMVRIAARVRAPISTDSSSVTSV